MEKKGAFDYILLETTGLADPGNIAPLFWVDDGLGSTIYLDGIVTLVDAKNILKSLDDPTTSLEVESHDQHSDGPLLTTAHVQISHADILVINKADLVDESELEAVKTRLQAMNGLARVHITKQSVVPNLEGFLLDLHAYDNVDSLDHTAKGHSHLDPSISTIAVPLPRLAPDDLLKVDRWLQKLLWDSRFPGGIEEVEVHRLKARLVFEDGKVRMVQGVREIYDILDPQNVTAESHVEGKMVIIGRMIHGLDFKASLEAVLRS